MRAPASPEAPMQPAVLLVDDHDLMRLGIKALVDDGASVVRWLEAASIADALQLYDVHRSIALVLLDLNLADCKGLQGLSRMLRQFPEARIIVLSGTQDEFVVQQAKAMGALDYLHKAAAPAVARDLVMRALGAAILPVGNSTALAPQFPRCNSPVRCTPVAELGSRHLDVLELVLSGCTNQEISSEMQLSPGTVKNYVSAILLALDVKSRSHLISLFS